MEAKQISGKMASVQKNLLTSEQIEVQFTLKMNEIKMNHIAMANTQTHRGWNNKIRWKKILQG